MVSFWSTWRNHSSLASLIKRQTGTFGFFLQSKRVSINRWKVSLSASEDGIEAQSILKKEAARQIDDPGKPDGGVKGGGGNPGGGDPNDQGA